jgi:F1F0 ATPase subunit 2
MLQQLTVMAASLVAGMALGAFYFGGLWLTMRSLPRSSHPVPLLIASYFVRLAAATIAVLLVALGGDWQRLLAFMAGFLLIKLVLIVRLGPGRRGLGGGLPGGLTMIRKVEDGNQP